MPLTDPPFQQALIVHEPEYGRPTMPPAYMPVTKPVFSLFSTGDSYASPTMPPTRPGPETVAALEQPDAFDCA